MFRFALSSLLALLTLTNTSSAQTTSDDFQRNYANCRYGLGCNQALLTAEQAAQALGGDVTRFKFPLDRSRLIVREFPLRSVMLIMPLWRVFALL